MFGALCGGPWSAATARLDQALDRVVGMIAQEKGEEPA
jgi:hypothetical protein